MTEKKTPKNQKANKQAKHHILKHKSTDFTLHPYRVWKENLQMLFHNHIFSWEENNAYCMPIARHFISHPGSPLKWMYINLTKNWHRATSLLYLGLHHYNAFFVSVLHLLALHKKTPFFYKIIFFTL